MNTPQLVKDLRVFTDDLTSKEIEVKLSKFQVLVEGNNLDINKFHRVLKQWLGNETSDRFPVLFCGIAGLSGDSYLKFNYLQIEDFAKSCSNKINFVICPARSNLEDYEVLMFSSEIDDIHHDKLEQIIRLKNFL